jgi:surface antigen
VHLAIALLLGGGFLVSAPAAKGQAASEASTPGQLLHETLEGTRSGIEIPWSHPTNGVKGIIRVERTFYRGQQPCRDYVWTREASAGDKVEVRGTGCRTGKAQWALEEKPAASAGASGSTASPPPAPPPALATGGDAAPAKPIEAPRPSRKPPVLVFTMPPRSDF